MERKIIYLVNPRSGTGHPSTLPEIITRETRKRNLDFDIVETNEAGDYNFLLRRIRQENITDVVVCGGDGSVNAVAAQLIGVDVNIGIIPLGSGNGLALTARIPRSVVKALNIVFTGRSSFIDGFYINNQFSCMLCGIGFDAKVAHDFAKEKRRGLQTYIKKSVTNYFLAKAFPFDIDAAGNSFSTEAFFISIANSNQFGNNFTIAPHASLSDGLLDIVIVKKMNKLMLPFTLLRHITGINGKQLITDALEKKNIIYFQTPALTITNLQEAPLHIDGEPMTTAKRFEIRVVREAMRLIH